VRRRRLSAAWSVKSVSVPRSIAIWWMAIQRNLGKDSKDVFASGGEAERSNRLALGPLQDKGLTDRPGMEDCMSPAKRCESLTHLTLRGNVRQVRAWFEGLTIQASARLRYALLVGMSVAMILTVSCRPHLRRFFVTGQSGRYRSHRTQTDGAVVAVRSRRSARIATSRNSQSTVLRSSAVRDPVAALSRQTSTTRSWRGCACENQR